MSSKFLALQQISNIAQASDLSAKEIYEYLEQSSFSYKDKLIKNVFGYLGAIFLLGGISAYAAMFWEEMPFLSRIGLTLGIGIIFYSIAIFLDIQKRSLKIVPPLYVISLLLQITGLFVLYEEYFKLNDRWQYPTLFVFGILFIQQFLSFLKFKHAVLLFNSIACCTLFLVALLSIFNLNLFIIGAGLIFLSYILDKKKYHHIMTPFWYFIGGLMFLGPLFTLLNKYPMELFFLLPSSFLVYFSTIVQSRSLLIVSILATFCFLSYFTSTYFSSSIGWPLSLVVIGFILLGLSGLGYKINIKMQNQPN